MERREFLIQVGKGVIAMPLFLTATSCGDDPAAPADDNTRFTSTSTFDSGHSHRITFQCTALQGGTLSYTSTNDGGHVHALELQASEVTDILAGATVGPVTSSLAGGHTHTWTITKPASACA
jgi:hypothetical protein